MVTSMNAMSDAAEPETSDSSLSPVVALLAIARSWDADLATALRGVGLTTRAYGLLGHIRATPEISFSELARRSRITVQSVHTAVGSLAASGLVRDTMAHAGARSQLQLTRKGERAMSAAAKQIMGVDERFSGVHPALVDAVREETRLMIARRVID